MAMTVRIDGADAEALRRRAEAEQRPVEDIVHDAIRAHVGRSRPAGAADDLDAQVAAARADASFVEAVDRFASRDREILDRLAE